MLRRNGSRPGAGGTPGEPTDGPTDEPTDEPTDGPTDEPGGATCAEPCAGTCGEQTCGGEMHDGPFITSAPILIDTAAHKVDERGRRAGG